MRAGQVQAGFGIEGAVISAVDIINGLGVYAGLERIKVPGATGFFDTNPSDNSATAQAAPASTNQMREFLSRLDPNDRVLLVGDVRQHQGVEAGRPFEQLQDAGMRTATLDDIVRQRDPALKSAVELLATGHVSDAAFQRVDRGNPGHELFDVPLMLGSEDLGQDAVDHD